MKTKQGWLENEMHGFIQITTHHLDGAAEQLLHAK